MDTRQILRDLRQNFIVVFLTFAVCVGAGAAAAFLPPKQYTASTQLVLTPTATDPVAGVALIQYLILQLPTEATNPNTLLAARRNVPAADATAAVTVTASAPPALSLIHI